MRHQNRNAATTNNALDRGERFTNPCIVRNSTRAVLRDVEVDAREDALAGYIDSIDTLNHAETRRRRSTIRFE